MNATEHTSRTTDSMRAYLSEIGRFPLLSHAEEITLGKQVQQLMSLVETRESLVERLGREPEPEEWATEAVLTVDELQTLVRQGELAKRRMIETNLRLVVSVAKKYQKHNVDLLDLIQEGGIGLQKGIEKFDPSKGYRLSTYIYWWIRQAVTRAIAEKGRTIRLSFQMSENLIKLRQAQRELFQAKGRKPTIEELATAINHNPSYIQNLLEKSRNPMSLNLRVGNELDAELGDLLEDEGTTPEEFAAREGLRQDIEQVIDQHLSRLQRQVLILRYGFGGEEPMTLKEIGKRLGMGRDRVSQIERDALAKLRQSQPEMKAYLAS